jgi:hypothetical protein
LVSGAKAVRPESLSRRVNILVEIAAEYPDNGVEVTIANCETKSTQKLVNKLQVKVENVLNHILVRREF